MWRVWRMAFSLLAEFLYDLNAQLIFLQHFFLFCLFIFLRHLRISAFEILLHVQTIRSSFLILWVIRMAGWRGFCLTSIKALYTTQNRCGVRNRLPPVTFDITKTGFAFQDGLAKWNRLLINFLYNFIGNSLRFSSTPVNHCTLAQGGLFGHLEVITSESVLPPSRHFAVWL